MSRGRTPGWAFVAITAVCAAVGVYLFNFNPEVAWGFLFGAAFGWWSRSDEPDVKA